MLQADPVRRTTHNLLPTTYYLLLYLLLTLFHHSTNSSSEMRPLPLVSISEKVDLRSLSLRKGKPIWLGREVRLG